MSKTTPRNTQEFVDYRIGEAETKIDSVQASVDRLNEKLDTSFASKDYVDSKIKNLDERISSIESDRNWAIRLVLGFVIMGILYAIVRFK